MQQKARLLVASLLALLVSSAVWAQKMPKMTAVEPASGKSGDEITVSGENLDKSNVAEIYLTDGKKDIKLSMSQQTAQSIKFKIPADVKPGRFALMILTAGPDPKLIEQPVKLSVE